MSCGKENNFVGSSPHCQKVELTRSVCALLAVVRSRLATLPIGPPVFGWRLTARTALLLVDIARRLHALEVDVFARQASCLIDNMFAGRRKGGLDCVDQSVLLYAP